jgi:hypothetical protein
VSSTDVLLNVATAAQLFHASDGTGFADLIIEDHRETWPLRSKRFQAWLRQQYYERTWDAPSPGALNAALNVLEAQAQFDGPQRKVSARLAEQDGLIYLDLADEFWRCIEIGPNGWRIAEDPPVRFRRSAGMQPLPLHQRLLQQNLPTADSCTAANSTLFDHLVGERKQLVIVAHQVGGRLRSGKVIR